MQLECSGKDERPAAGSEPGADYALVRQAIDLLTAPRRRGQPPVADWVALGLCPALFAEVLARWSGQSPAAFAQTLSAEYIRGRLAASSAVLDGMVGDRGPIHAFDVEIAATICDERRRGAGLDIAFGAHACPFGEALLMMTEGGLCGLAFIDEDAGESWRAAREDMIGRWPKARFREAPNETGAIAARIFGTKRFGGGGGGAVPLTLIGTLFDAQVWQTLLRIPMGVLVSYADIARHLGQPLASRAVGTANGRNPISFVVPCHRALRGDGSLGGYYWGLTRKRALIAWEAGRVQAVKTGQFRN